MTNTMKATVRSRLVAQLLDYVTQNVEEDVALITSGSFNFPIVEDGEEAFVEIVVKIPNDEGEEAYGKREDYLAKVAAAKERAAKAKAKADKAKAKKKG